MPINREGDGYRNVVFDSSAESNPVQLSPGSCYSLTLPSSFSTASISFKAESSSGSYEEVYYNGALFEVDVVAGKRNIIPVEVFAVGGGRIKIVSDTSENGTGKLYMNK